MCRLCVQNVSAHFKVTDSQLFFLLLPGETQKVKGSVEGHGQKNTYKKLSLGTTENLFKVISDLKEMFRG